MWKIKPPVVFPMECRYRSILENLVPPDPMSRFHLIRGSAEEEFPYLRGNTTCMGRVLDYNLYQRQFTRCTEGGVIFDDVIRLGLEEPSSQGVGCVASDAQCYVMFCDFFDRVIERYHDYKISNNMIVPSDLNHDNLKGGDDLDSPYVTGSEVSVVRGVEPFSFPSHCSRGERRELHTLATRALQELSDEVPGRLHSIEELTQHQGVTVSAPSSTQMRTGVARDWPDGRAVWVSRLGDLVIWVNFEDHLKLVSMRQDGNLAEAFRTICVHLPKVEAQYRALRHGFWVKPGLGWVSSSPANVGTGLRASVTLALRHLPQHRLLLDVLARLRLRMEPTEFPVVVASGGGASYRVSNAATIGLSEVELTQLVVDGVKLLVAMETRLEGGASISDLVPAHKV